jgi:hypothetical protein
MKGFFDRFRSPKVPAKYSPGEETQLPTVAEVAAPVASDPRPLDDASLDDMVSRAGVDLASIVLCRTQAPVGQHGVHAEISLKDASIPAPNGDRADLIAHGGKVTLEFQHCTYVPRSMNARLDCTRPLSQQHSISRTWGQQSEAQGEAVGELSVETQMEGGMTGFRAGGKMAGRASGKTGQKRGDTLNQTVTTTITQQIISGSCDRGKVEITIDPLRDMNNEVVRSHGRLWNDQVVAVHGAEKGASITAYYQSTRDGDIALSGGTGIFAESRSMEQQKIVDMLFRRLLSGQRWRKDSLDLPDKPDDNDV